jgi:hypothetical protein
LLTQPARVSVRRVCSNDVADPAEGSAGADPEAGRHNQPEQAAEELAVIDLAKPRNDKREHRGEARVRKGTRGHCRNVGLMRRMRKQGSAGCKSSRAGSIQRGRLTPCRGLADVEPEHGDCKRHDHRADDEALQSKHLDPAKERRERDE